MPLVLSEPNRAILLTQLSPDMIALQPIDAKSVAPDDNFRVALEKMHRSGLVALPILSPDPPRQFSGFLEGRELVYFVLDALARDDEAIWHSATVREIKTFASQPRSTSRPRLWSSPAPLASLPPCMSMSELIEAFSGWNGIAAASMSTSADGIYIVSQRWVLKLLSRLLDRQDDPFFGQRIRDAFANEAGRFVGGPLITVGQNQTIREAFQACCDGNVESVGLLDESGGITGNLSISDIRYVSRIGDHIEDLRTFCGRPCRWLQATLSGRSGRRAVSINQDATVGDLLTLFEGTGLHRIYVVDDQNKPLGILGMKQMLNLFK